MPHEVGDNAEIFRDDLGTRFAEDGQHPLTEPYLILLVSRHELRLAAVERTEVRPIETNQMIDAVAVVDVGVAVSAIAQPIEVALGQHVPPVDRKAPVLTRLAERIRRDAD